MEDFTNTKTFLQVNGDLYVQYQNQLKQLASGRPVVGISWSGGFWAAKKGEGLGIENWLIFEKGALCVNLQYGNTKKEEEFLRKGFRICNFSSNRLQEESRRLARDCGSMRWNYLGIHCSSAFRGCLRPKGWNCDA